MQHRPVITTPGVLIDDKCRGQVRLPLFPDGLAGPGKSGDPPCFSRPPQSRYLFEGWAFGSVTDVATDGAGILATDCWRASSFSVSVAICLESFFVSAC